MAKKSTRRQKLIISTFVLAEERPWRTIALADIAGRSGVSLVEVMKEFRDKNAIIDAAIQEVTEKAIIECGTFTDEDSVRDRLFALLMARLDAMEPYRRGGKKILRSMACDPISAAFRMPSILTAMAQMLESAGVDSSGLCGALRTKGLMLVFADTTRIWLADESEDLAATMAALDKNLARADMIARQFWAGKKSTE